MAARRSTFSGMTTTENPFTVIIFDVDGNDHAFTAFGADEDAAVASLNLDPVDYPVGPAAVLTGKVELNQDYHGDPAAQPATYTVIGQHLSDHRQLRYVVQAHGSREAVQLGCELDAAEFGYDELGNSRTLIAGAVVGAYPLA